MHLTRPRHERRQRAVPGAGGFTLLELTVVLVIIMMMLGIGVMSFDSVAQEHELRKPVLEFKSMTMEAVRRAALYERPQVLIFDQQGMLMRLQAPRAGASEGIETAGPRVKRFTLPPHMVLSLRRFGSDKFVPAAGQRLIIAPSGLCEPITARFEQGRSWFEVTLDPLTGGAREESMIIQ